MHKPILMRRILVVDDGDDARETMGALLRMLGHEVAEAGDGAAALSLARTFGPGVVILDIGLPDIDGFEVAARLREQPGGKEMKLIALTGFGQRDMVTRALLAGFDHHVVKPLHPDMLDQLLSS